MTDTPTSAPLESSSNSGTTPDTVIEGTARLALDETLDEAEILAEHAVADLSELSDGNLSPTSDAHTVGSAPFPANTTKVYYHVDDEQTPYMTEVHVPPELITLGDVKRMLTRSNFKFYAKTIDPDSGFEVKAELRDDMQPLHRSPNGRFELFLLTTEGSAHGSDGASSILPKGPRHHMVPGPAPSFHGHHNNKHYYDSSMFSTDSESTFSGIPPNYLKGSLNRRQFQPQYMGPRFFGVVICRLKPSVDINSVSDNPEDRSRQRIPNGPISGEYGGIHSTSYPRCWKLERHERPSFQQLYTVFEKYSRNPELIYAEAGPRPAVSMHNISGGHVGVYGSVTGLSGSRTPPPPPVVPPITPPLSEFLRNIGLLNCHEKLANAGIETLDDLSRMHRLDYLANGLIDDEYVRIRDALAGLIQVRYHSAGMPSTHASRSKLVGAGVAYSSGDTLSHHKSPPIRSTMVRPSQDNGFFV